MFNRFVASELRRRGWRGPSFLAHKYWSAAEFEISNERSSIGLQPTAGPAIMPRLKLGVTRRTIDMTPMLKYIELKTGYHDNGPAWIARVKMSKSGRTIYFNGRALKRGVVGAGNFFDSESGEVFWVSGVKRDGSDRHRAGSGRVLVEAAAVEEYLATVGRAELDTSRFAVTYDIRDTDPATFVAFENKPL